MPDRAQARGGGQSRSRRQRAPESRAARRGLPRRLWRMPGANSERPPPRRSNQLRSTTQALEQVTNVVDGQRNRVIGLEDEAPIALNEPGERSCGLDLDAAVVDGDLDLATVREADLLPQLLWDDDTSRAVDGSSHGRKIPFTAEGRARSPDRGHGRAGARARPAASRPVRRGSACADARRSAHPRRPPPRPPRARPSPNAPLRRPESERGAARSVLLPGEATHPRRAAVSSRSRSQSCPVARPPPGCRPATARRAASRRSPPRRTSTPRTRRETAAPSGRRWSRRRRFVPSLPATPAGTPASPRAGQ